MRRSAPEADAGRAHAWSAIPALAKEFWIAEEGLVSRADLRPGWRASWPAGHQPESIYRFIYAQIGRTKTTSGATIFPRQKQNAAGAVRRGRQFPPFISKPYSIG